MNTFSEYVHRTLHLAVRQIPCWLVGTLLLICVPVLGIADDRTLTLVTWNIEHLAADDDKGCRPRNSSQYEDLRKYLNRTRADVVAFQEVENLSAAKRIFSVADYDIHISERPSREFPACSNSANNRLMQRTGFAVRKDMSDRLGMRAVRQPDVRELEDAYDSGRRGVYLLLEHVDGGNKVVTGAPLHLLSIHLKSKCTYQAVESKKLKPCSILNKQIDVLSAWINARARSRQNFIIAGDFNRQLDQLSDAVWLRLEAGGKTGTYVDLEKALHGVKHPKPYYRKYPYAIDHVIYNQALDGLIVETKTSFDIEAGKYSDHLQLFAVFDLSRSAERKH